MKKLISTILPLVTIYLLCTACPEDVDCPGGVCVELIGEEGNFWFYDSLRYTQMQYVNRSGSRTLELYEGQTQAEVIVYQYNGDVDSLYFDYQVERVYNHSCEAYHFRLVSINIDSISRQKFNLVFNPQPFATCATLTRLP